MKRLKLIVPVAALGLSIGLTPAVFGATRSSKSTSSSTTATKTMKAHHTPDFEAVVNVYKTHAAAAKALADLNAKGISNFKIEPEGRARFEIERPFKTMAEAKAEVAKLVTAGFKTATTERS
jgi:hypothetical protein